MEFFNLLSTWNHYSQIYSLPQLIQKLLCLKETPHTSCDTPTPLGGSLGKNNLYERLDSVTELGDISLGMVEGSCAGDWRAKPVA